MTTTTRNTTTNLPTRRRKRAKAGYQPSTKQRLLDTALRAFAEKGYHGASIRDICKLAHTNVSTVNYHFHGKEKLYRTAVECAAQSLVGQIQIGGMRLALATSTQRRRGKIQPVFFPLPLQGDSLWPIRLIIRQLMEPGPACDGVVTMMQAHAAQLEEPLRRLLGPRTKPELVHTCALNLLSQYLFFSALQPALHQLHPTIRKHNSNQFIACFARPTVAALKN